MVALNAGERRRFTRTGDENYLRTHAVVDFFRCVNAIAHALQAHIHQHYERLVIQREGYGLFGCGGRAANLQPKVFHIDGTHPVRTAAA